MIQASELRLGNFINDVGDGIGQVLSISKDDVLTTANDLSLPIDNYMPIPLTEEWLLRFGALRTDEGYEIGDISLDLYMNGSSIWVVYLITKNGLFRLTQLEYVHQLQNLCFTIKGKELEEKSEPINTGI